MSLYSHVLLFRFNSFQASQVYEVVSLNSVAGLVPFGSSLVFVEQVVCEAVANNFLRARINCNEGVVQFGGYVSWRGGREVPQSQPLLQASVHCRCTFRQQCYRDELQREHCAVWRT